MGDAFDPYAALIYQLYGVSFVGLGVVALALPRHDLTLRFARHLWLLGVFGLLHGVLELLAGVQSQQPALSDALAWVGPVVLLASYFALLEFGRVALHAVRGTARLPRRLVHGVACAGVGAMAWAAHDPGNGLSAGARYFVGAPGALLSSLALLATVREDRERAERATVVRCMKAAGVALATYAVLIPFVARRDAGLPSWLPTEADFSALTSIPVQLARATCAFVVAGAFVVVVRRAVLLGNADLTRVINTLDGFVYRCKNDRDWTVTYMSAGVEALSGYRPAEFLVERTQSWGGLIHPDDAEPVWNTVQAALAAHQDFTLSYRITARSGELRWVYERGRGVFDAEGELQFLDGHVMNDTVRMEAIAALEREREALRASRQQLREILDSMFAFVGLFAIDGEVLDVNQAPLAAAGVQRQQVIGRLLWDTPFFAGTPDLQTAVIELFRSAARGQAVRRDVTLRVGAEATITVDAALAPVRDDEGRITRIVGSAVDVTEQRELERQSRRLEAELRQAQKLDALGTLAGGIAHDFNNVLMAIVGNVELARLRQNRPDGVADALAGIAKAAGRAQDLVQRILAFSRRQEQALERIALVPVIDEVLTLLRATLPARVELRRKPGGEALQVLADASQVHQVIMNLATNAWHALGERSGAIEVGVSSIVVDEEHGARPPELSPGRYVRVDVSDDGCGMNGETLEHVFEPFFTTKPLGQGTGLGLSMVHGIVTAHGGAVALESELGKGTTVRLYFPEAQAAAQRAQDSARPERARGAGEHLMLVDDEPSLIAVAKSLLEGMGFRVTGYTRADLALEAFEQAPDEFALVITDHSMPGMSGTELARRLRALRPYTPVIMLSGFVTRDELDSALQSGVAEVVMKPISFDRLGHSIAQLLATRSAGAVASAS